MLAEDRLHTTSLAVAVIPVDPDGFPVLAPPRPGAAVVRSPDHIELQLDAAPDVPALVLGFRSDQRRTRYLGVDVTSRSTGADGRVHIHGQVGGLADALLQPKHLTPRFHFDTMTFTFGFPPAVLHRWEEIGVLEGVVIDRLLLCPQCHGLPTIRHGCRRCGSGRVIPFVAPATEAAGRPDVPLLVQHEWWARALPSVDGAPAPVAAGYLCQDCRGRDTDLGSFNQCLHCGHRFTASEAYEMVLRGYRAHRFDPATLGRLT